MTRQQLQICSDDLFKACMAIMMNKGKDYHTEDNVFKAFYNAAAIIDSTPEKVCFTYLLKHIDKIARSIKNDNVTHGESLQETIMDSINYLILLYGMIDEFSEN